MVGVIYRARNIINNKVYIGLTTNYEKRLSAHKLARHKMHFHFAIKKHGWNNFLFEIIHTVEDVCIEKLKQKLSELEKEEIINHDSKKRGYNLTTGGQGVSGVSFSDEIKKEMSDSRKGDRNHFYGKKHTEESRAKMSNKLREMGCSGVANHFYGRKHTMEFKLKASESRKGEKHPRFGIPLSPETKQRMSRKKMGISNWKLIGRVKSDEERANISAALIGRIFSDSHKAKISFSKKGITPKGFEKIKNDRGVFVEGKEYASVIEASKHVPVKYSTIYWRALNNRKDYRFLS